MTILTFLSFIISILLQWTSVCTLMLVIHEKPLKQELHCKSAVQLLHPSPHCIHFKLTLSSINPSGHFSTQV